MDFQPTSRGVAPTSAEQTSGLTLFFRDVYAWMAAAVAISGLVAYFVAQSPTLLRGLYGNPVMFMVLAFAPIGVALYFQRNAAQMSTFAAANLFFAYATLVGVMLSSLLVVYTGASVGRAFFVASACFGGAAAFGTVTRREMSQYGQFLMVGLIGVFVGSIVNIFLRSSAVEWVVSMAMVVVFAGLTAWDHQSLKRMYAHQGTAGNMALIGAFSLYVNFINLFIAIMRLTGNRRDD